jgi:cytochrome c peroxidase
MIVDVRFTGPGGAVLPRHQRSAGRQPDGSGVRSQRLHPVRVLEGPEQLRPYPEPRKAVARGEAVFNTHPLTISGVAGLNDALGVAAINGTCTTCHDTPNVGNHSRPLPLDIGISHVAGHESDPQVLAALGQLSMPDLPVFQVTCQTGPLAGTMRYTSDPGRSLISGKCADIGRLKGPILRALVARAPFFHNGAAATLKQVVAFYNLRFQMGLTDREKADLEAFLRAL